MSDDEDGKSEDATAKRLADAADSGNLPISRDTSSAASLIGAVVALIWLVPVAVTSIVNDLRGLFAHVGDLRILTSADSTTLELSLLVAIGFTLLPCLAVLLLSGLAAGLSQGGLRLAWTKITPNLSHVSPAQGWKRIFGFKSIFEVSKSTLKAVLVGTIALVTAATHKYDVLLTMSQDPATLPATIWTLCVPLLTTVAVAMVVVAGIDLVWSRFNWHRSLQMSRQDIKEEHRQNEGDPFIKARMRSVARQRARSRMMSAVPRASFVIANPQHIAIALRYVRGEDDAPRIVAKGRDLIALRIRAIAEANGVPVIENKPLARALDEAGRIEALIPPPFYKPVAEIVNFLAKRRKPAPGSSNR